VILLRFRRDGIDQSGILDAGQIYSAIIDDSGGVRAGTLVGTIGDVTILPPTVPSKIIAVGLNYGDPSQEGLSALPDEAILSFKPPSSVIATEESILLPTTSTRTDYEGELAVVVGTTAKNVETADANRFILGYTCANDVTARDVQRREGQWAKAKGYDTFCPLGPWIVTDIDPADLALVVRVNGGVRQSTSTSLMFFRPDQLLSYISKVMTLNPGDVILTGTPPGVGQLSPGDVVEVEIEGVGVLRNPVARSSD
jgi:2-keto-4-pentenoate hydratase/2-oxohepta-3-ene-1,7-dioic acid hydratase in catechol pathway